MGRQPVVAVTEKKRRAWERLSKGGRLRYVILRGVLLFGGGMFLLTTLLSTFTPSNIGSRPPMFFIIDGLVWCIAGYLWGTWTWHRFERRFGAHISDPQ